VISIRNYAKYILREGAKGREAGNTVMPEIKIYLKDKRIYLEKDFAMKKLTYFYFAFHL